MIFKDIISALNWVVYAILTGLGAYGIRLLWSRVHHEDQLREKKLQNEHKDGMRKTLAVIDGIMSNLVPLAAVDVSTPKGQRKGAVISEARKQLQSYGITDTTAKMLSGSAEKVYQRYKANHYSIDAPKPASVPNLNNVNNVNQNQRPVVTHINQSNAVNQNQVNSNRSQQGDNE